MAAHKFSSPVAIRFTGVTQVRSARQAAQLLMDVRWPNPGPRHRDAKDTCLKVMEGHRSTIDAEHAFLEAAREAAILVQDQFVER